MKKIYGQRSAKYKEQWAEPAKKFCLQTKKFWGNKSQFFEILTQKCHFFCNWPLMPEICLTDFETGILTAVKKRLYVTSHLGCWFHYTQCIFQKFQELGLSREYKNDPTLHLTACRLFSLPFLPVDELIVCFQNYQSEISEFFSRRQNVEKIFSEHYWILDKCLRPPCYVECFWQGRYPENYQQMQKLEYEMEQRNWGRSAKFLEFAEKIKCPRNRVSHEITKNFAWQTSPEKTTKVSVTGRKNNSPEKFLSGGSLVIENVWGGSCSHWSKLLKN